MYYDMAMAGERIQMLRKEHGLTQVTLSEKLGVTESYLSRVERGEKGCSVDMFVNLSDIFSVSLDYLILGKSTLEAASIKGEISDAMSRLSDLLSQL